MEISVQDAHRFNHVMNHVYDYVKTIQLPYNDLKSYIYEYNNCIERWIISNINATADKHSIFDVFDPVMLNINLPHNKKLIGELVEKHIFKAYNKAEWYVKGLFKIINIYWQRIRNNLRQNCK